MDQITYVWFMCGIRRKQSINDSFQQNATMTNSLYQHQIVLKLVENSRFTCCPRMTPWLIPLFSNATVAAPPNPSHSREAAANRHWISLWHHEALVLRATTKPKLDRNLGKIWENPEWFKVYSSMKSSWRDNMSYFKQIERTENRKMVAHSQTPKRNGKEFMVVSPIHCWSIDLGNHIGHIYIYIHVLLQWLVLFQLLTMASGFNPSQKVLSPFHHISSNLPRYSWKTIL